MLTQETKAIFQRMIAYYNMPDTAGSVWGPQALQQMFPNFPRYDDDSMTTDALCTEVRVKRVDAQGKSIIKQFEDMTVVDPRQAVAFLQKAATDLSNDCSPKKVDVYFADAFSRRMHEYGMVQRGERVCVVTWPWEPIQKKTLGIKDTDYIILYGRPKSMKTWVLCFIVAWCVNQGLRVLVYTKEMPPDEVFERIGCCLAGVDYEHFTTGAMTPEEVQRADQVNEWLQLRRDQQVIVCLSGQDARGTDTVTWLEAKVEKYQPHLVAVDGMYLMTPSQGSKARHERIASISQDMRQLVLRRRVPVIATVQANRKAAENEQANTEDIAFSDSLGQDATMLMRVVNEHKKGDKTCALVMGGATRRFHLDGFRIHAEPAFNFNYFGELTAKEAEKAVTGDDAQPKGNRKGPARTTRNDQEQVSRSNEAAARYNT